MLSVALVSYTRVWCSRTVCAVTHSSVCLVARLAVCLAVAHTGVTRRGIHRVCLGNRRVALKNGRTHFPNGCLFCGRPVLPMSQFDSWDSPLVLPKVMP